MVSDIDEAGGQETVKLISEAGGARPPSGVRMFSEAADVAALVEAAVERFGRLDCACNKCRDRGQVARSPKQSIENYEKVLAGAQNLARHLPVASRPKSGRCIEQGGGAIVNLASVAGLIGFPGPLTLLLPRSMR